ncbi:MAG: CAP domain-containing protein [Burkholderiales bacterium]
MLRIAALLVFGLAGGAHADLVTSINHVRAAGCEAKQGGIASLRIAPRLGATARSVGGAVPLQRALKEAGYRSRKSAVLQVSGAIDDAALAKILQQRFCATLIDGAFREIGIHRDAGAVWVVLAAPFAPPGAHDRAGVARQVLDLVNQARAKPRACGKTNHPAARPLKANGRLDQAALAHAKDMAAHSTFSHDGRDGSAPAVRVSRAGYAWQATGENIAAGNASAEETVAGWLQSPAHCANIMDARFTELGVGFAVNEQSEMGIYWVQAFGRPR